MSARVKSPHPFPRRRVADAEPDAAAGDRTSRWPLAIDICLAVALGLAVLLVHDVPYMLRHSFWVDEAWVADIARAPIGQTHTLGLITPVGWAFLMHLVPLGGPERLRLVPLVFTMLAAAAGYLLGRELRLDRYLTGILTGAAVLLSPAMLVRDDLKEYTAEACATLIVFLLVARVENEWRFSRLWGIAAVTSLGLLFSNTVIFVGVAAMASLGLECLLAGRYRRLLELAAAAAAMLAVSLAIYVTLMRPEVSPRLAAFWDPFYVPTGSGHRAITFVYRQLVALAPYGGFRPFAIDVVGVLAGIAALIWLRRYALAVMFPATLAIVIVASAARKYPFGDLRTSTFWLVMVPVLMAIAASAVAHLSARIDRRAPLLITAAALAVWVPATDAYIRTHSIPNEDVHSEVTYLDSHFRRGDVVLLTYSASYAFAYYYPAAPSFPVGDGANGHIVAYPALPWMVVMGARETVAEGLAQARAKIAAEPAATRGRIWIVRSHQTPDEDQAWNRRLAGQPVQVIRVGHDPIVLYKYRPS